MWVASSSKTTSLIFLEIKMALVSHIEQVVRKLVAMADSKLVQLVVLKSLELGKQGFVELGMVLEGKLAL